MDARVLEASRAAAAAALHSAISNAGKPGASTSEFKALVGGAIATGIVTGLHVLSILPGPWMVPALALSGALSVAAYAVGRSHVKSAVIAAAAAVVVSGAPAADDETPGPVPTKPIPK